MLVNYRLGRELTYLDLDREFRDLDLDALRHESVLFDPNNPSAMWHVHQEEAVLLRARGPHELIVEIDAEPW